MSKLTEYSKTAEFMNISLEIDGVPYKFNLDLQLRITEEKLTTELKEQPRAYAFLCMLRNKIITQIKKKEKEVERKRNTLFNKHAASGLNVTQARNKANASKELNLLEDQVDTMKEVRNTLDIAVTAFEQRKDLLQTLSSNLRKEK